MLGMGSPKSAQNNVVSQVQRVGLIDDDGALTARGNKWRLDASYGDACQEILDDVYPGDLAALTDDAGAPDASAVRRWFDHKGFGESNARQMAATYTLIATKQVPDGAVSDGVKKVAKKATQASARPTRSSSSGAAEVSKPPPPVDPPPPAGPNVHLDIQIHIPADASPEQIEHIFESMAKHLYKR
ncbi:MAG TPA: hypothetical protein VFB78_14970 [Acidimicrobiales bacterium]|nr:hypothetical protein [Acidimicrobiales bacterium]